MRAKMSDPTERMIRESWYGVERDRIAAPIQSYHAALALDAQDEARGILAETEPPQEQGASGHWFAGRPNRAWDGASFSNDESGILSGTAWAAHEAIKVSLSVFINQEMS